MVFFELADGDDYMRAINAVEPLPVGRLIDNKTPGSPIRRMAPDNYLHIVNLLRRHLASNIITDVQYGVGRVQHVDSTTTNLAPSAIPSEPGMPGIIQPIEGSGPSFLSRIIQVTKKWFH